MPSGIVAGEKLVVCLRLGDSDNVTPVVDSQGFTQRTHVFSAGDDQHLVLEKTAGSSEPASYTFAWAVAVNVVAAAFRIKSEAGTPVFDSATAEVDLASPWVHPMVFRSSFLRGSR